MRNEHKNITLHSTLESTLKDLIQQGKDGCRKNQKYGFYNQYKTTSKLRAHSKYKF